jgi:hypothetical protein
MDWNSRSMATGFGSPGAYAIVDADKVLRDNNGVVAVVQATD